MSDSLVEKLDRITNRYCMNSKDYNEIKDILVRYEAAEEETTKWTYCRDPCADGCCNVVDNLFYPLHEKEAF